MTSAVLPLGIQVAASSPPVSTGYVKLRRSGHGGGMVADWRGPASCWLAVSPLLRRAAEVGWSVRVFGEMVSMLWDAGLVDAAIEVEAMWNELGGQYPFSLLCVYPARPVT